MSPHRLVLIFTSFALVACGSSATPREASVPDAGAKDASAEDGGGDEGDDAAMPEDGGADAGPAVARVVAVSRAGKIASIDAIEPFTVRATTDLGDPIGTVRCAGATCITTHPSSNKLRILDALDLHVRGTLPLGRQTPRDIALLDAHTALVSISDSASLLIFDPTTAKVTGSVDLSALADADGVPDAQELAHCGRRAFLQLARIDHTLPSPASDHPVLAVVDLDRKDDQRLIDADPMTPGTQGVALAHQPDFDMPIDCAAGILAISEPRPLMMGGSAFEQVDLKTLVATRLPLDTGAEGGGFEPVDAEHTWMITHTEFGPGPSSHLEWVVPGSASTYNTFAPEHIDDLAFDRETELIWFPDGCDSVAWDLCDAGLVPFHALTGERATTTSVDLGFPPIEVEVAR